MYVNASATYAWAQTNGADWASLPSGVGYVDATENHPDWFLRDTRGNRIEYADYADMWMMDFGSRDYQEAWLANVAREVKENGWDGRGDRRRQRATSAFIWGRRTLDRYPTAADQQRAMKSFLATVGPGLTAKGILALPEHHGRVARRALDLERLDPVHVGCGSGVLDEVGLGVEPPLRRPRLGLSPELPESHAAGREDLPRESPTRLGTTSAR